MIKKFLFFSLFVATGSLVLHAGVIDGFTLKGVALPDGPILDTITLDGTEYNATSMINGTMTGVTDSGQVQLMAGQGAASVPPTGSRDSVMSDLRIDTALLNINEVEFTFDQAIVNTGSDKIDLVFFDWGAFDGDNFTVTINGTTFSGMTDANVPAGGNFYSESISLSSNWFATPSSSGITTVNELNTITFSTSDNYSKVGTHGVIGLDLSDFGVLVGESITTITLTESGSVTMDPSLFLGVQSVPEASSLLLVGFGLASVVLLGRKNRY